MTKIGLLQKNVVDKDAPRNDNADKLPLFGKDEHLRSALQYQHDWEFIADEHIRRNISYQLQYLEFLVKAYNTYRFYLVLESMTLKTIIVTIGSIVEAALLDLAHQAHGKGKWDLKTEVRFTDALRRAENAGIIDRPARQLFESLRRIRNNIHLASIGSKEYQEYDVGETNLYIVGLNNLYTRLKG